MFQIFMKLGGIITDQDYGKESLEGSQTGLGTSERDANAVSETEYSFIRVQALHTQPKPEMRSH
jgi:hypothetical protein